MVYVYKLKGGVPLTAFDGCAMVAATSTHHFATILLRRQSWQVRVRLFVTQNATSIQKNSVQTF